MKFLSEGKFYVVFNMVVNFINFFDNIMLIFYFLLQGSKIFSYIFFVYVDVKKVKFVLLKKMFIIK